jgi:hypothetical protein
VRFRRKRQCKSALVERVGIGTWTTYCTRLRHDDPFHANAFEQVAWVEARFGKPITYQYPYEHLKDDTEIVVRGVQPPVYHREERADA